MTESINNSGRLISCSFSEENLSPSSVGDHLMMCGNKTDQCPHCKKFIRRAIFAYHYENNCADLDETSNEASTVTQPDTSTRFQGNVSSHLSSRGAAGSDKEVTLLRVELSTNPTTQNGISHRSKSDFFEVKRITVLCTFCNQKCEIGERKIHQENCLRNLANIAKSQQPKINRTSNPSSDRSDDIDIIPCEYCNEPIKCNEYKEHTEVCDPREFERRQNQSRPVPVEANVS